MKTIKVIDLLNEFENCSLNDEVEIIEEIEKPKEIETIKISEKGGSLDKVFNYIDGSNLYSLSLFCANDLVEKINELIDAVNDLKKEDDK